MYIMPPTCDNIAKKKSQSSHFARNARTKQT